MRFVLGNRLMNLAGGTETHLVTVGVELLRLGHDVTIYSPELGPFAEYARTRGLEVVGRLPDLPGDCDVVLAQDTFVVYDLAERYPDAFMVFRICGDSYDFQTPPQVEGLVDLVVVLSNRYERLAEACAVRPPILRLRLPVDDNRLVPIGSIGPRPRRAVVLGNYPDRIAMVREAWEPLGIEVTHVGGAQQRFDIADALATADVVVAKSRAALDAMACARAVYVLDMFGGDGWVTPSRYAALEADHFAGQASGRVIDVAELAADLAGYRPEMGVANRDLAIQHHRARDHVIALVDAIAVPTRPRPQAPLQELSRLVALQWSWERFAREAQGGHGVAHDALVVAKAAAEAAAAAREEEWAAGEKLSAAREEESAAVAASLRAELDAIRASRTWRLTGGYRRVRGRLAQPAGHRGRDSRPGR